MTRSEVWVSVLCASIAADTQNDYTSEQHAVFADAVINEYDARFTESDEDGTE